MNKIIAKVANREFVSKPESRERLSEYISRTCEIHYRRFSNEVVATSRSRQCGGALILIGNSAFACYAAHSVSAHTGVLDSILVRVPSDTAHATLPEAGAE